MRLDTSFPRISVHIFNPEHDYALVRNGPNYTPPVKVQRLRNLWALLPAVYAEEGDAIFIDRLDPEELPGLPFYNIARVKRLKIVTREERQLESEVYDNAVFMPWGWDRNMANTLRRCGANPANLPTEEWLDRIRELSHRRLTIDFLRKAAPLLSPEIESPAEIFTEDDARGFIATHGSVCFKAPWSSSGRGLVFSDDMSRETLMQWVHGIINTQGSVMAEKRYTRTCDWGTEWVCRLGIAKFLGFSHFQTTGRGKYKCNDFREQREITATIFSHFNPLVTEEYLQEVIEAQKEAIEKHIAPFYSGPLGIDMLTTESGNINPCVEINIRNTMGHVAISVAMQISEGGGEISETLRKTILNGELEFRLNEQENGYN